MKNENSIVYCHGPHAGFGEKWSASAGHKRGDTTFRYTPEYGGLWHCPEHAECGKCDEKYLPRVPLA